jgi:hypothetical protein
MCMMEVEFEDEDSFIWLDKWRALVNTVMNIPIL